MDYLKAEQTATSRWRVLAIPFGGPFKGKDFDGEYFSPQTDIKAEWFKERPALWHHAMDEIVGDSTIGMQSELTKEKDGWWGDVWLERSNRYWAQVDSLLRAGKVFGSSGALAHLVKKAPDGEILVWPHIEQTLTPTPANPFARVTVAKAAGTYTLAGLPTERLKALVDDLDAIRDDLSPTWATGGDSAAPPRLVSALDELEALISDI